MRALQIPVEKNSMTLNLRQLAAFCRARILLIFGLVLSFFLIFRLECVPAFVNLYEILPKCAKWVRGVDAPQMKCSYSELDLSNHTSPAKHSTPNLHDNSTIYI